LGRARFSVLRALWLVPLIPLALWGCDERVETACFAFFALATVFGLSFYGRGPGQGVVPGMIAGAVLFPLPFLTPKLIDHCGGVVCGQAMAIWIGLGLVAGVIVGLRMSKEMSAYRAAAASAVTVAFLTASMSCVVVGLGGLLGLSFGLVAGAVPAVALARPARAP
jgi:hypothetical protein